MIRPVWKIKENRLFFHMYALDDATLIHASQDRKLLLDLLTYETVEELVKKRVEIKARQYGQVVKIGETGDIATPVYKIKPSLIANLYGDWVMPLTKEVQVEYLLRRLD